MALLQGWSKGFLLVLTGIAIGGLARWIGSKPAAVGLGSGWSVGLATLVTAGLVAAASLGAFVPHGGRLGSTRISSRDISSDP